MNFGQNTAVILVFISIVQSTSNGCPGRNLLSDTRKSANLRPRRYPFPVNSRTVPENHQWRWMENPMDGGHQSSQTPSPLHFEQLHPHIYRVNWKDVFPVGGKSYPRIRRDLRGEGSREGVFYSKGEMEDSFNFEDHGEKDAEVDFGSDIVTFPSTRPPLRSQARAMQEGTLQAPNSSKRETWTAAQKKSWLEIQQRRKLECLQLALQEVNDTSLEEFCPRVWDQILCWPPAPPRTRIFLSCYPRFPSQGNASRYCDAFGNWSHAGLPFEDRSGSNGWSNYTECVTGPSEGMPYLIGEFLSNKIKKSIEIYQEWLPTIKKMSMIGYSISLVTLGVSFSILISLRKLRCPRNILHLHLFASFMLRATVVLLKGYLVKGHMLALMATSDKEFEFHAEKNGGTWWCKVMMVVWQYFIVANYSWILMEGLYLHNLIFMALFSDSSAITLYIALGWGLPLVFVASWAILRSTLDDLHCWTVNSTQWIFWLCIRIPVALSNFVNFFFFLNVTRVLVLKLRSSITAESMKYRKLGKSTLVLVPLFGVHYFLLWGLSTSSNVRVELAWLFLDQVFASFQGFFVAVLYCLMNGEVRQELRKIYHYYRGDASGSVSQATVVSHTKTYLSPGRSSIHSTLSASEPRVGLQTSYPQHGRGDNDPPCNSSPMNSLALTPCYQNTKLDDLTKCSFPDLELSEIELESMACVKPNHDNRSQVPSSSEEETPLLFMDAPSKMGPFSEELSSAAVHFGVEVSDTKQVQFNLETDSHAPDNRLSHSHSKSHIPPNGVHISKNVVIKFDPVSQSVETVTAHEQDLLCDDSVQNIL